MSNRAISIPGYEFPTNAFVGRGAFGSVWVGYHKGDLPRAVKVFEPGGIHEDSWRREYEKLRALDEPPGIVTLYDCGHTDSGAPYVSMRLMADRLPGGGWTGRTLSRALGSAELTAEERWRLVGDICDTLAYLHRKGVNHCDVKPSNILLTEGDEPRPVLCDFGQSRSSGAEGGASGTAFYASPDQLRDAGGPAPHWDVYSFGATAYQLLTGKLPRLQEQCDKLCDGALHTLGLPSIDQTLIEQRSEGPEDFGCAPQLPPPGKIAEMLESEAQINVPGGLVGKERERYEVVLRCLRLSAGRGGRYADMGEVANAFAEVERRSLVAAERRRNCVFATLTAFGLCAAAGAGWGMFQAREARDAAQGALEQVTAERGKAVAAEAEAGRQRDLARHAQGLSERLVNQLLYDLRERLEPLGKIELLDQVSKHAESYFASLPETERGAATERERSTMLNFRGEVYLADGDLDSAMARFAESLAVREALLDGQPGSDPLRRDVSVTLERIAEVELARGELAAAEVRLQKVIEMRRAIFERATGTAAARSDLALALQKLGEVYSVAGRTGLSIGCLRESVSLFADAEGRIRDRQYGVALMRLGDAYRSAGQTGAALEQYELATAHNRRLLSAAPENVMLLNDVAAGLARGGEMLLASGDAARALDEFRRCQRVLTRLLASHPDNAEWRTHLALIHEKIADALGRAGDDEGAGSSLAEACELTDAVLAASRTPPLLLQSARLHRKRGECTLAAGGREEAEREFFLAAQILAELPPEPEQRIAQVVCYYNLYALARESGETAAAFDYCRRSLDALKELKSANLLDPQYDSWIGILERDRETLALAQTAAP